MGSLIMHLAVSNEIKRIYNFSDRFLFGSIMPDIKKRILNNRSISHYSEKIYLQNNSFKNLPNLEIYMKEHKEILSKIVKMKDKKDVDFIVNAYLLKCEKYFKFNYFENEKVAKETLKEILNAYKKISHELNVDIVNLSYSKTFILK